MPADSQPTAAVASADGRLTPASWQYGLRINLAPLCLALVALLHLYLVERHALTPWKGGGFGMFSTVDTRSARFLRIYVETDGRWYPVRLPKSLDKLGEELRAAPSRPAAQRLADQLLALDWGVADRPWPRLAAALANDPLAEPLTAAALHLPAADAPETALPPAVRPGEGPLLAVRSESPAETPDAASAPWQSAATTAATERPLAIAGIRLEVHRFRFDAARQQLAARPLLIVTAPVSAAEETAP